MTPTRKRRLIAVLLILAGVGIASTIAFYSLQQNLLYFQSPSELALQPIPPEATEEPSEVQKTIEDFKRIFE